MGTNKKYGLIEKYSLIAVDTLCLILSYPIAFYLRFRKFEGVFRSTFLEILFLIVVIHFLYLFMTNTPYQFFIRGYLKEAIQVCYKNVVLFVLVGFFVYAFRVELDFSRLFLGYFVIANSIVTWVGRMLTKNHFLKDYRKVGKGEQLLIVTTTKGLSEIKEYMEKSEHWSFHIAGTCLTDVDAVGKTVEGFPIIANRENVFDAVQDLVIDSVFIYNATLERDDLDELVNLIELVGIQCNFAVKLPGGGNEKASAGRFIGIPVVTYNPVQYDWRKRILKRFFDIFGSFIGLIITGILFPFIALAIKINSKGPVIYKSVRVSKNGRLFTFYKFRSMYAGADLEKAKLMAENEMSGPMFKMENDPRITKVGKFLRKTSLDELPQFYNVLKGDMSLVGVRPPTKDEYDKYDAYAKRRLCVRPGITGLWQVSGRNDITDFSEVLKLDFKYIDEWCPSLDLKILVKTVGAVFNGR